MMGAIQVPSSSLPTNTISEDFDAVREILKPYDPGLMRHCPVNPRVNSVQNDAAECAAPITLELPEQARLF